MPLTLSPEPDLDAPAFSKQGSITLARISEGLEADSVAGIAEIVRLMETLTRDSHNISVQELAEVIEKDAIVTAKVLSASNLMGYNPSCVEVSSIEDAIKLVGFSKIRTLALSLLLMENLRRADAVAVHRKAATLALTSSLLTQSWAQTKGREDADYAFLYTSLRHFGHLLLAAFMPVEYQQAKNQGPTEESFDCGCAHLFGLSAQVLGQEQLRRMALPPALLKKMCAFQSSMLHEAKPDDATQLMLASEFSTQLAELTLNKAIGALEYAEKLERITHSFKHALGLNEETLKSMFAHTEQKLQAFGRVSGGNAVVGELARRFSASHLLPDKPLPSSIGGETTGKAAAASSAPAVGQAEKGRTSEPLVYESCIEETVAELTVIERLMETIVAASTRITQGNPGRLAADLQVLCDQVVRNCWGAEKLMIFRIDASGRYTAGAVQGTPTRGVRIHFNAEENSVFGVAARRGETVRIHDAEDPRIRPHLPPWFTAELKLQACLIVPVGAAPSPRMVVCCGWGKPQRVPISPAELRALRALFALLANIRRD